MACTSEHCGRVGRPGERGMEHGVQGPGGNWTGDAKDGNGVGDGENKGGEDGVDGKESEEGWVATGEGAGVAGGEQG